MELKTDSLEHIMEKMDEYLVIDPMDKNLDQISLRSGRAFSIAQNFYRRETRNLEILLREEAKLKLSLRDYYLGEANPSVYVDRPLKARVLKTDVEMYIKVDELFIEMNSLVEEQRRKIKYIEQCFERIRSMGYEVRNAIDWRKYRDGN